MKLARRGIDLSSGREIAIMRKLRVRDAMITDVRTVDPTMPIPEFVALMQREHRLSFPVVDARGRFLGTVRAEDVEEQLLSDGDRGHVVGEIIQRCPVTYPDESLEEAIERFGVRDQRRVPVVARDDPHRLLGMLQAWDVLNAYRSEQIRAEEQAQSPQDGSTTA